MVAPADVTFGRLAAHQQGDDQDALYPLRAAMALDPVLPPYKYWSMFFQPLNQGDYGTCVGHGAKHWMMAAPVVQTKPDQAPTAVDLYREAILLDEWPDNDNGDLYFGTSVRAVFKALAARGLVSAYRWADNIGDVRDWVLTKAPLVIGVLWYEGMMQPDAEGYIHPTGAILGGHCVLVIGHNRMRDRRPYTILNSWGAWGPNNGRALISEEDLDRLLFAEGGEAAAGIETRLVQRLIARVRGLLPWTR